MASMSRNDRHTTSTVNRTMGEGELIHQSERTRVWRLETSNGDNIVCKETIGPDAIRRREHEMSILKRLSGVEGVPTVLDVACKENEIRLNDVHGVDLKSVLTESRFDPQARLTIVDVLSIARQLVDILIGVHGCNVVHKDINPSNIILFDSHRSVLLVDFELATTSALDRQAFTHQSEVAGTLAYIPPEQTGRTGRGVDHRADLYAVGATFYELTTGQPPFGTDDMLALIHDHLARVPVNPTQLNPAIPPLFAQIILRLLNKEPDQRYQSAKGLAFDLDRLSGEFENGKTSTFVLGERDFPRRLVAPSILFGRDDEIAKLADAFERSLHGEGHCVLISGVPGVGKTALADELRSHVAGRGGWFVAGKFDQYQRQASGTAVDQALGALTQFLLSEPETTLQPLREDLRMALGPNAGLLAGFIPEVGLLLDIEAERNIDDLAKVEARVTQAVLDFMRVISTPDRPIVIVLDDLQWAAATPIGIIDAIIQDEGIRGLLVVGAFRDEEVDELHPLTVRMEIWQRNTRPPLRINVENLSLAASSQLLAEMLRIDLGQAETLSTALERRSHGNPYDTVELLNALRNDCVLVPKDGGWSWDERTIRSHVGAGDVVELVNARIDKLPPECIDVLETMACLGSALKVDLIASACALASTDVETRIGPALEDGLLTLDGSDRTIVQFRHDRVQQAAHIRLGERLGPLQLRVARRLASLPDCRQMAAELYLPVCGELSNRSERLVAAELFYESSLLIRSVNLSLAEQYLGRAAAILADIHGPMYELILIDLHNTLYSLGRFDDSDAIYARLAAEIDDLTKLAAVASIQVSSLTNRGMPREALDLGLIVLREFGIESPEDVGAALGDGLASLYQWLSSSTLEQELLRAPVEDPRVLALAELLRPVGAAAFFCEPTVLSWLLFQSLKLWIEEGPCVPLVSPLGPLCLVTVGMAGDYRAGYTATYRIKTVGEQMGSVAENMRDRFTFQAFSQHWGEPLERVVVEGRELREHMLRVSDTQTVGFTYNSILPALIETSGSLEALEREVKTGFEFIQRSGYGELHATLRTYSQFHKAMTGRTLAYGTLDDDEFKGDEFASTLQFNPLALSLFTEYSTVAAAVFGDVDRMAKYAQTAFDTAAMVPALYINGLAYLTRGLHAAWRLQSAAGDRDRFLEELDACCQWMSERAQDAPENFRHLALFLSAERAWAVDDFQAAATLFDAATREIDRGQRPWHLALLLERTGALYMQHELQHVGQRILAEARDVYRMWGASAKVEQLESRFPYLRVSERSSPLHSSRTIIEGSAAVGIAGSSLDLLAVIKASQALSSETNLDRLRDQVVEVVGEMTGATAVQLVLWSEDAKRWTLTRASGIGFLLSADYVGAEELLPLAAFRYAERTRQPLLVEDATRDERFSKDPYLEGRDRCSLLIAPILSHGALRAMLVVENDLSGGVFTRNGLDAVTLITAQLAVSLDNALAERFRSLVQRSSDLTLVCDRQGVLSYASTASAVMLGVENTELVGRSLADIVRSDDVASVFECLQAVSSAHPETMSVGAKAAVDDLQVDVTFTDLSTDPAVAGIVLHLRDVTERSELEAELRRSQKMESIGQLAAGVAHEINTPIQFIGDNTRFVADAFGDLTRVLAAYRTAMSAVSEDSAFGEAQRLAREIDIDDLLDEVPGAIAQTLDGVSRVSTIVDAMKAFGYSSGDRFAPADLNEAIGNTLVIVNSQVREVADVVTELGPIPPVVCSIGDINQVLLNLIVNAAQAIEGKVEGTEGRGVITVKTFAEGEDVCIQVVDTGGGIPRDVADRVFEQFFTTKNVGVGTGQGLSISYSIVHDRHGGSISFSSTPGEGTTFTVRLPVAEHDFR